MCKKSGDVEEVELVHSTLDSDGVRETVSVVSIAGRAVKYLVTAVIPGAGGDVIVDYEEKIGGTR